jgi:predicted metal-dependent enzyme (double-stranded beta helix superfamily)
MFDVEAFVGELVSANSESDPRLAVRDVLDRALADSSFEEAFGEPAAGLNVLYNTDEFTVLNVVWPPHMTLYPHDHRMWAAIAIYGGQEDNVLYRRNGHSIEKSGGKTLNERDVLLLGDDVVHSVHNPLRSHTGAIHVYGGNFIRAPRSQWPPETLVEEPYDLEAVRREFVRAEQAASVGPSG